jgi:predicted dehydrogenase
MTGQASVSWSDESQRKMTTKLTIWGTDGRINVDRQECQVYLRDTAEMPHGYTTGWNVRYTTDLTKPVDFYVRGEEYTAQIDSWIDRIDSGQVRGLGDFADAAVTDEVLAALVRGAGGQPVAVGSAGAVGTGSTAGADGESAGPVQRGATRGRRSFHGKGRP